MSEPKSAISGIAAKEVGHSVRAEVAKDGQAAKFALALGKPADPFINNFSTFTEWAGEADCQAFDGS